jgi:uncharacterized protein (DUF488 family)
MPRLKIWTVGHSTRTAEEFRRILLHHEIELVADVRRFPGSRCLPQFASATLERDLAASGIHYHWLSALGGRRRATADSLNTAWRSASFRAYADHLSTEDFAGGLEELLTLSFGLRTAIMCAEVLWWRCHRRLIADVLTSLDATVLHIRGEEPPELHRLTAPARVEHGALTYRDVRARHAAS